MPLTVAACARLGISGKLLASGADKGIHQHRGAARRAFVKEAAKNSGSMRRGGNRLARKVSRAGEAHPWEIFTHGGT